MTPVYRPGFWCDVFALPDGRLGQVVVNGATVTCYVEDAIAWSFAAPEALLFCRAIVHGGRVLTLHQGQNTGTAWRISEGSAIPMGLTFGVQPVAFDILSAYIVRSSTVYDRIDLTTDVSTSQPSGVPGSSQGISDVPNINDVWWADLHRNVMVGDVQFSYPNQRNGLMVGQAGPPQIAGSLEGSPARTLIAGEGYEPHVATDGMGRYAVCARTPFGAAWLTFQSTDFWAFPPVVMAPPVDPPTVDPPKEPPTEPPTEPPVDPPVQPPIDPPIPPQPPEVPDMKLAVDMTHPPIKGIIVETEDLGNGQVALKSDQGYLSIDSFGDWKFAPTVVDDERFTLGATGLVNINTFSGTKVSIVPMVQLP